MSRELIAILGEREVVLRADPAEADSWRVVIDGKEQRVDAREVRPGTWSLLIGVESLLVNLDVRGAQTIVRAGGAEARVQFVDAQRHRLEQAAQRGGESTATGEVLCAPIAGRVVKVLAEVGATVAARQPVMVLEAMKMENEICAERGGTVEKVHVAVGASVDTGATLITLV